MSGGETNVLTISYMDLVIFAHVAQARVGEENFQYASKYHNELLDELNHNELYNGCHTVS